MVDLLQWSALVVIGALLARLAGRVTEIEETADRQRSANRDFERMLETIDRRIGRVSRVVTARPEPVVAAPQNVEEPVRAAIPKVAPEPIRAEEAPETIERIADAARVRSSGEWETLLGGSWLNKAGVVLLVVGVALLLGYSLNHLGAAGRIALGAATGLAMLTGGAFAERLEKYRVFGHGLTGGGWAAMYFTAYAAHGIHAARVIANPGVATVVLGAVSVAMIWHSLCYRSQAVTAVAYLLGFVTLATAEQSAFATAAIIPLAVSLLYVAQRFSWTAIALGGVPATYGLFLLHTARIPNGDPALAQLALGMYSVLFEGFDLIEARRGFGGMRSWVLNTACFVPLTYLAWHSEPGGFYIAPAIAAAVYLLGTFVRAWLVRKEGSYYWPVTACAGLTAAAILARFEGNVAAAALLAMGELLFVAGYALRQRYLQTLGNVTLGGAILKLFSLGFVQPGRLPLLGHEWRIWTPLAALAASVLYFNRALASWARYQGYAGGALLALVLGAEMKLEWIGVSWLVAAAVLFEVGLRRHMEDVQFQAGALGAGAIAAFGLINALGIGSATGSLPWAPQLAATVLLYAGTARLRLARVSGQEICSTSATTMLGVYLWNVLPAPMVAPAWAAASVALWEAGSVTSMNALRRQGQAMAMAAFGRLFFANFDLASTTFGISHRILTVLPVIALQYYLYGTGSETDKFRRISLYTAAIAAVELLRFETGRGLTVVGWSVLMLAYLFTGRKWEIADLRLQAYIVGAMTLVRCWTTDLADPAMAVHARIATGGFVAACFYAAQQISPRTAEASTEPHGWQAIDVRARMLLGISGSALVAFLLYLEVSGRLLTIAWAIEGIVLLAAGLQLRERILRLSGLALLIACMGKLFAYDLRNLDTPYRIASFLVLGLLLIGVSWVYSKFRAQIERYL